MEEPTNAYYVSIEDLFRVEADRVDSAREAEQLVLRRLGEGPFVAYEARVVDVE